MEDSFSYVNGRGVCEHATVHYTLPIIDFISTAIPISLASKGKTSEGFPPSAVLLSPLRKSEKTSFQFLYPQI